MNISRLEYLRQFSDISESEYELLTAKLQQQYYAKGSIIISPGDIPKGIYFVKSGIQMAYFESGAKINAIAFTYYPDLFTIPEALSFQHPSPYSLICLTDSELEFLSLEELVLVFDKSPALERLFRKMTESILGHFITRHIELHTMTIKQRYISFCRRSAHLLHKIPHKYIASYLGIDPTNFSKLFNSVKF